MQALELEPSPCNELISTDKNSTSCSERKVKKSPLEKFGKLLGGLHINYTLYFFIPLLIFSCLYSYHMAVKKKE